MMDINQLTGQIIGAAIEVHKTLGPGLLETAYEECLCRELSLRGFSSNLVISPHTYVLFLLPCQSCQNIEVWK